MPFDRNKFSDDLQANALPPYGAGLCATYVRQALVAAGLNTVGNPLSAKDYRAFLETLGFKSVAKKDYLPQKADIVVLPANSASAHGHVAGFTGKTWVSDFVQNDMFGGPSFRKVGVFEILRYP